jgi:peptide/nickel transport system substrate-binding protein
MARWAASLIGVLLLVACAAPPASRNAQPGPAAPAAPAEARTLNVGLEREPSTLGLRPLRETFAATYFPNRTFNADFAYLDDQGAPQPYLVEALPQLNTDGWRVFPDGRMETTYRFLSNLAWQDGTPFAAEDYVFGWQVYSHPDLGLSRTAPFDNIDDVVAVDPRTLLIRWKKLYPDAGHMAGRDRQLAALPRHLLQSSFESESADSFTNLPYWTRDYVGLGPYKLVRWEPGAFIETATFAAHARGKAKIDRMKITFIRDRNTALANALSGEVDILADNVIQYQDAETLRREWEARHGGTVIWQFNTWRGIDVQARRAFVKPEVLTDVRVRAALSHAVDKQALTDSIYGGVALLSDYVVAPLGIWAQPLQRGLVPHPYDVRRADQLMRDAGFERGADGMYASLGGRLSIELKTTAGSDNEKELAVIADGWHASGFDINQAIVPSALSQDLETRASYPGLYLLSTPGGDRTAVTYTPDNVPLPENRWRGGNRSGWTTPEYAALAEQFKSTLDLEQRKDQLTQMARLYTEDVASISLYFRPQVWAHSSALRGPVSTAPDTDVSWNMPQWELQ